MLKLTLGALLLVLTPSIAFAGDCQFSYSHKGFDKYGSQILSVVAVCPDWYSDDAVVVAVQDAVSSDYDFINPAALVKEHANFSYSRKGVWDLEVTDAGDE